MKVLNLKYIISISFIIIIALICMAFINAEEEEVAPKRAILVLETGSGGKISE